MYVFEIEDPNEGLREVLQTLKKEGISDTSRNGEVLRFDRPVCLRYLNPRKRLLTSPVRDANPFFHLFETMWMFAGMNQLEPLLLYNPGMAQYSDDGSMLRGTAYGHRWRSHTWGDQLEKVVDLLSSNPGDRRAVLTMWDANELATDSKDFACNLQVVFSCRPCPEGGRPILDMAVTNRSNDLIYGAMGSNLFHFSMLHEYVSLHCDLQMGVYHQISTNLHVYTENKVAARCLEKTEEIRPDHTSSSEDTSLTDFGLTLDAEEIRSYVENRDHAVEDAYLGKVVVPLVESYHLFKCKSQKGLAIPNAQRIGAAIALAGACQSSPLKNAATDWLQRRLKVDKV